MNAARAEPAAEAVAPSPRRGASAVRPGALALALAWTAGLLAALLLPQERLPLPDIDGAWTEPLAHVILFAGTALLWRLALPGAPRLVAALAVGLALATEALQGLPAVGRGVEPLDVLANGAGLALGLAVAAALQRRASAGGP